MSKHARSKSPNRKKSSPGTVFETQSDDALPPVDDLLAEAEVDASSSFSDVDLDDAAAEQAEEPGGDDDQIDDPVRIYLMQMGEIPLLKPQEELAAAKRIKTGRRRFRQCMLANDYVLQAAVSLLESIRDNKLRLDRTIEVSVINIREKRRLLKVLDPNLQTLHHLLASNREDFTVAIHDRHPGKRRREAWQRLLQRRVKAVRLVEELGLRTQRLQPLLEKLKQISRRMEDLKLQLDQLRLNGGEPPRRWGTPQGIVLPDEVDAGKSRHAPPPARAGHCFA